MGVFLFQGEVRISGICCEWRRKKREGNEKKKNVLKEKGDAIDRKKSADCRSVLLAKRRIVIFFFSFLLLRV